MKKNELGYKFAISNIQILRLIPHKTDVYYEILQLVDNSSRFWKEYIKKISKDKKKNRITICKKKVMINSSDKPLEGYNFWRSKQNWFSDKRNSMVMIFIYISHKITFLLKIILLIFWIEFFKFKLTQTSLSFKQLYLTTSSHPTKYWLVMVLKHILKMIIDRSSSFIGKS